MYAVALRSTKRRLNQVPQLSRPRADAELTRPLFLEQYADYVTEVKARVVIVVCVFPKHIAKHLVSIQSTDVARDESLDWPNFNASSVFR